MTYVGTDHSTTGIKTTVLHPDGSSDQFTIERTPDGSSDWSFIDCLSTHVSVDEIDLVATGYSYGDNFSSITDISSVENRGVVDHMGAGHGFGTGTQVFDELKHSSIPCVLMPGVHNGLDCLHPYFSHYSVYSGADTVAMSRYAKEISDEKNGTDSTFIAACISSSAMATLVHEGTLVGGFHWLGLIHGHIDIELLREIETGTQRPRNAFMKSGLLYRSGKSFAQVKGVPNADLLEQLSWATRHHVHALVPFANQINTSSSLDQIVLSGRLNDIREPFDMKSTLDESMRHLAPVHFTRDFSTAMGAAYIARDVCDGADDILGIPVGKVPVPHSSTGRVA